MVVKASKKMKKKHSKNKKKYWKKHVDLQDIEAHLNDQRLEERLGGPLSARPDDSLFEIDIDAEVSVTPRPTITIQEKRMVLRNKPLKCFSILIPSSKVEDPISRNKVKSAEERKSKLDLANEIKRKLASRKYRRSLTQKTLCKEQLQLEESFKKKIPTVTQDAWAGNSTLSKEHEDISEFHNIVTRKKIPKRPRSLKDKPSELKPVSLPHPGTSYNPQLEDYNELLSGVCNVEVEKEKAHLAIERQTTKCFPTIDKAPTKESLMKEMSQGLGVLSSDEEEGFPEEPDVDAGNLLPNPPVNDGDRKTKKSKRKEREARLSAQKRKIVKSETVRQAEVFRIKKIEAELNGMEHERRVRAFRKLQKYREKTLQPLKLSRYNYEEPDADINHPSDIAGNLRNVKAEGHILQDRYYSMQKRNIIETRIPQKKHKRKYRLKKYTKRSHK